MKKDLEQQWTEYRMFRKYASKEAFALAQSTAKRVFDYDLCRLPWELFPDVQSYAIEMLVRLSCNSCHGSRVKNWIVITSLFDKKTRKFIKAIKKSVTQVACSFCGGEDED